MIDSNVLEVVIGLVFCYASVALMASSIFEAIANWFNLRSRNLFNGICALLNTDESSAGQKLLLSVYNDALAHPLGNGKAAVMDDIKNKPSYIAPTDFAKAFIQAVQSSKTTTPADTRTSTDANATAESSSSEKKSTEDLSRSMSIFASLDLPDSQLKTMIESILDKTSGDVDKVQAELAKWFDSSMESVSATYRRHSQFWCFIIAIAITVIFNIDSVQLFKNLWQQPTLVTQVGLAETGDANAAYQQLRALPIGWQDHSWQDLKDTWFVGWLVTASASLFGAPFWFELLKNLGKLRPQPKKD